MNHRESKLSCVTVVLTICATLLFLFETTIISHNLFFLSENNDGYSAVPAYMRNIIEHLTETTDIIKAIQYVPESTVYNWSKDHYLVVFGIPSVDISIRRGRRNLQRTNCWTFPGVATRSNNFTGDMLVLYILARHPSHNYTYSEELIEEANEFHDIITLDMNEGKSSTNKTIGTFMNWGREAEIGLSKKVYFWYELAVRLFPNAKYYAKADDDVFIRVPQYLADLQTLPRKGTYWGYMYGKPMMKNNETVTYYYAPGTCYTLSRDISKRFVSYEPLRRLVHLPYTEEREFEFVDLNMTFEDMMVGRILYEVRKPFLLIVKDRRCRFHNLRSYPTRPVTNNSIVIHDTSDEEFNDLMNLFRNDTSPAPKQYWVKRKYIVFSC